jgi:hypothetical protein
MFSLQPPVWREWHPIDWAILRRRHVLGDSLSSRTGVTDMVPRKRRLWDWLRSWTQPNRRSSHAEDRPARAVGDAKPLIPLSSAMD